MFISFYLVRAIVISRIFFHQFLTDSLIDFSFFLIIDKRTLDIFNDKNQNKDTSTWINDENQRQ